MTVDDVTAIMGDALFMIIKIGVPVLLVSLIIGLTVSIFQTVTSIQEQTLTFVPKLIAAFLTMMLLGSWMLDNITGLMEDLWNNFALYLN